MTLKHILATLLILILALYTNNSNNSNNNSDCLYIKGGGFSGFWYYYGYLQKNKIVNNAIYCYSSGCVAYVAYVASINYTNESYLYDFAHNLATDYNNNKINRYDLKDQFINIIANNISSIQNYNLNILTSNYLGQYTIKKPTTVSELIVALDETTNIPLITTKLNFSKKLDGVGCITFINKCATIIELPYNYKIYRNALNVNLSYEDIIYFLNYNSL